MLSGLLNQETQDERIHGIQVAIKAPVIMHLFFGDNILLFTRENFHGANNIMATLQKYHISYGGVVNLDKSEASFSRNFRDEDKDMVRSRMGVKLCQDTLSIWVFRLCLGDQNDTFLL